MRAVSFSIALTENYTHNGALMIMPGSHRTFVSCVGETPDDYYKTSLKSQNVGTPDQAFEFSRLPHRGIGLARLEFVINRQIGIHPRALLELDDQEPALKAEITSLPVTLLLFRSARLGIGR